MQIINKLNFLFSIGQSYKINVDVLLFNNPRVAGLNVGLVLQTACQEQNIDPDIRDHAVEVLARHVDDVLRYQRELILKSKNVFLFALVKVGRMYGAYVSIVYVFIKVLHLSNSVLQFYLLNKFLETADYPLFGGHVLYDLFQVFLSLFVETCFW